MKVLYLLLLLLLCISCDPVDITQSDQLENLFKSERITNGCYFVTVNEISEKDLISQLSKWCSRSGKCSTIMLPFGEHDIRYNIKLFAKTSLDATPGTKLNLYPTDSTTAMVKMERRDRFYVEDCAIRNIELVLKSPVAAVVQTGRSHKAIIENCKIEGNNLAGAGIVIGDKVDMGAIGTILYNVNIRRAGVGVSMIETGGKHRLNEMQIRNCKVGIDMQRGMLLLENSELDHNGLHINISGNEGCFVSGCTMEQAGIIANNIKVFSLLDSKMSGGFIELNDVKYAQIEKSKLNALKHITGAEYLTIVGNYFQPPELYEDCLNTYCNEENQIYGNHTGREIKLQSCKR